MIVGIPKETFPGERRVALVPANAPALTKLGCEIIMERGAGAAAGFTDKEYEEKGVKLIDERREIFAQAEIILQVRGLDANPELGQADLDLMHKCQVLIGFLKPFSRAAMIAELAKRNVVAFALELMPRITRAQSMDALSSMASLMGYKAVLLAANALPKMFPMMMTPAGTITPAKVFIIGAGVAGLQAIATARRLGGVVQAYDIRPAVREEVESLGAKFVQLPIETGGGQDKNGYAKAMDEEFYSKQRQLMSKVVAESDVVIATAFVPGKKAPVLVTEEMLQGMSPGSVVIDLAVEQGGNCALSQPDRTVLVNGVSILGPVNLASQIPYHASQLYSRNLVNFTSLLVKQGLLTMDLNDAIVSQTMVANDGQITSGCVCDFLKC